MSHVRLCLALHNHQPVGNFGHVFEAAYQDSYLPFLEVFEQFESLKISVTYQWSTNGVAGSPPRRLPGIVLRRWSRRVESKFLVARSMNRF